MTLSSPVWLLLIIPIVATAVLAKIPRRAFTPVRIAVLTLLVFAVCGLGIRLPSRAGVVVMVADRSLSMPTQSQTQQMEMADLLYQQMGDNDELGVVAFGERVFVEQPPQRLRFPGFVGDVGSDASNLGDALDRAISLVPPGRPGRILIVSDGNVTGSSLSAAAARAASSGIAIDYRPLQRTGTGDLAIERVDAPQSVSASEAFLVTAWITSPRSQEIEYELRHGNRIVTAGKQVVPEGRTRLLFRDKAGEAGTRTYQLQVRAVDPASNDPLPENNQARFLVGVRGVKPMLCVSPATSSLPDVLTAGGLEVVRKLAEEANWTLEELSGYSSVLIENIPANKIGTAGMENLAAWVTETGGGLLTTGGRNAYGIGGYYKSPLEPIFPVTMELRREHRKLSLAIVVALDRSGSMAMTVPGGRTKMDLANAATVEVLDQLGANDQLGVLAVDSSAHEIVPLSDLSQREAMKAQILKIDSLGGGIFVYEALEKAAAMIAPATAGTRHVILFSDAADSEEPGDYVNLLNQYREAGVTVSVIGLGTEHDSDAELLKDIARLGGGQCMFTENPHELPRLFAQDTFLVSRSTFIEEPTSVRATPGLTMVTSQNWGEFPQVGGYNLCYLRPGANQSVVTEDEYKAPIVATWQAGSGRVANYMGEADGKYSGPMGSWPKAGEFFTSLARWVGAQDQGLGADMLLTQEVSQGRSLIKLHLDSERERTPFNGTPHVTVLRGRPGQKPTVEKIPLQWTGADVLSAETNLSGGETLITSLDLEEAGQTTLPPVCLPYSPEFAPRREGEGIEALERLARATGGKERIDLTSIWGDLPKTPRNISLGPWLLLTAIVLLLMDILQRRTGLLSLRGIRRQRAESAPSGQISSKSLRTEKKRFFRKRASQKPVSQPQSTPKSPAPEIPKKEAAPSPVPPASEEGTVMDALTQARNRASRRTQR